MDDLISTLNYILDCSTQRLKWYIETGDKRYMDDCKNYLSVANIYMKEVSKEQETNEV